MMHVHKCRGGQTGGKPVILVEGLGQKTGRIANLPTLLRIRERAGALLFVDETLSFGVLGRSGRGVTEHFDCRCNVVDAIFGSLEYAVPSCGAFCAGRKELIRHQILYAPSYCFSAASPPAACTIAFVILEDSSC